VAPPPSGAFRVAGGGGRAMTPSAWPSLARGGPGARGPDGSGRLGLHIRISSRYHHCLEPRRT
jgi:hypothetical protein